MGALAPAQQKNCVTMTVEHAETALRGDVSPYLQQPLRTLSEAQHDHQTALLDLVTTDIPPKAKD
jgi:hypothetical protein